MTSSTVPGVLTALLGVFPGKVFLGEPLQHQAGDFVSVAWAGPDNPAVSAQQSIAGARLQREEYRVVSQIVAWQGTADLAACITRAYAALDAVADALFADKTLGGACMQALLAGSDLSLNQTDKGAQVILSAAIDVTALRP